MDELFKLPGNGKEENPARKHIVHARFTKAEKEVVAKKAKEARMGLGGYIHEMSLHGEVTAQMNEEEILIFRHLVSMSNNFQLLAEMARKEGLHKETLMFEEYRDKIDKIINKIENVR